MYAIIETGGKQYKVEPGQIVPVEKLDAPEGKIVFDRVLLCADGANVSVGTPTVAGAKVSGEVLSEFRTTKVLAFKRHKRKDWMWQRGHRQDMARVRIDEITVK